MLKSIKLHGVGPVRDLTATFGERLNLITGDNGLGKSFLLDLCFWSLTGTWPGGRMAIPDRRHKGPTISYEIQSKTKPAARDAKYDFRTQSWSRQRGRPPMPGLVIYAAVDGSFAVWDPARNYWREPKASKNEDEWPRAFQFPPKSSSDYPQPGAEPATIRRDVANGLEEAGRVLCNGLIADWGEWFYRRSTEAAVNPFRYLEAVVEILSHPLEPIQCDEPQKVFLDDSRKFPTLQMPYGVVPYPQWSAGMKRVISFAYLIVWAWIEHLQAAILRKEHSTNRIVLIVDEIEAHLHPKWQRTILPAILQVVKKLQANLSVQVFAATHSPLVLASVEPYFDETQDQLFCFALDTDKPAGKMVSFDALPWAVHGDVVGWLTSDVFGLEQARSREAETAIEAAEAFMRGDTADLPAPLKSKNAITAELKRVLSGLDPFWPRWIVEAKQ
jgi:hypothetical protein